MKILFLFLFFVSFLYSFDGATIYNRCKACHGQRADRVFIINKNHYARILAALSQEELSAKLKDMKHNPNNYFLCPAQLANLSDRELEDVSKYISLLNSSIQKFYTITCTIALGTASILTGVIVGTMDAEAGTYITTGGLFYTHAICN